MNARRLLLPSVAMSSFPDSPRSIIFGGVGDHSLRNVSGSAVPAQNQKPMIHETTVGEQPRKAKYLSAERIAVELFDPPVSVRYIRGLQSKRAIPFVRLGGKVLFDPEAVRLAIMEKLTVFPQGTTGRAA